MAEAKGPVVPEVPMAYISANFKKVANFVRDIVALDEVISKLGGLDSAIVEAQTRLTHLKSQEAEAVRGITEARARAEDEVNKATAEAIRIMNDTRIVEANVKNEVQAHHSKLADLKAKVADTESEYKMVHDNHTKFLASIGIGKR